MFNAVSPFIATTLLRIHFKFAKYQFFTTVASHKWRFNISNCLAMSSKLSEFCQEFPNNLPREMEKPLETVNISKGSIRRIDNIEKSEQDSRDYRGLVLENNLKVLLVSDPKTDVSAAAMAVQVGHMSDPDNLPGLAHFCEHMLFLGTEKYPDENAYTTYLTQSGGNSNAATYPLMTKYYFHVATDKLDGALDRFAQFFIAPLFTCSATEREINAVNSEHEKNIPSDVWRVKQVVKHLAKDDHAYKKFGTGNKATLCDIPASQNIDVRRELLEFYKTWYSANLMSLAVLGKQPLDELEQMVIEKFSHIENLNVEIPHWPRHPYEENRYNQKVMVVPVKNLRSLSLSFTTDDLTSYYKSGPDNYVSHLLGHEGKGSILSELKRLGWCNELVAGHQNTLNGFGFFDIVVELTQDGLNHVDDIIKIIYQYLNMLREVGPQKWIFDEYVKLSAMHFRFKEKEKPETLVSNAVTGMQVYPLEDVLKAPFISDEWRPELICNLLAELIPSKCRITLVSQSYSDSANLIEPIYGTKYGIVEIPQETLETWQCCSNNDNLALPSPNAFIPENFELVKFDDDLSNHPIIIIDTPILRVWHKQDNNFLKPKACLVFNFYNPIALADPLNFNLNYLMVSLIRDQLNEYTYDASLADLKLNIGAKNSGIELSIRGYNDKQLILLETVLKHIFEFEAKEKRFNILKDEYIRTLKNFNAEQPYQHSMYYLGVLLTEHGWANAELLNATELLTFDGVVHYAKEFISRVHTESFLYGNINKQQAHEFVQVINQRLETTNSKVLPLLSRQMFASREYKLNVGDSYVFEKPNTFHKSSCVQVYFQCGTQTDRSNIMVDLLAQILTEPCYDCLRTKEQLGYIVFSGARKVNGVNGVRIIVQSSKKPWIVEERIKKFLSNFWKTVEEMPLEEFERYKESLAVKKSEKPKTVYSQFLQYYNEIGLQQYHFDRNEMEIAILRSITKEDLLDRYKKCIAFDGVERRLLAIHIISTQSSSEEINEEANCFDTLDEEKPKLKHQNITDVVAFKASKGLYPIPTPYLNIRAKGARCKL